MIYFLKCYLNKQYLWNNFTSILGLWVLLSQPNAIFKLAQRSFLKKSGRSGRLGVFSKLRSDFVFLGFFVLRTQVGSCWRVSISARDLLATVTVKKVVSPISFHVGGVNQMWGYSFQLGHPLGAVMNGNSFPLHLIHLIK